MLLAFFRIPDYYPCKSKWLFAIYAHYCALHVMTQSNMYCIDFFQHSPSSFFIRIFCIPVWIQPSKTENQVNDLRDGIAGILLFSSSIVFKENRNSVENIQMPKNRQKKEERTSCNSDELLCKKSLEEMSKKVSFEIFQNLLVIFSKDYNYGVHEVWARWKIKIAIKMVSKK